MIAKNDWFERRKYGGWGLGKPRKWQGWAYLAAIFIPFIIFQNIPYWDTTTRVVGTVIWIAFLLTDLLPLMVTLKKDEREHKIESIAERNAAWTMMIVLTLGLVYQIVTSALKQELTIDWFLAIALFGGMLAKTVSNIYLERRTL